MQSRVQLFFDPLGCPWDFPGKNTGVGCHSLLQGSPRLKDQTHISCHISYTAGGFFTAEPPGKPESTGVSSLSPLQGIFLIQESNWGLLNCRQILYQLSYQGSPILSKLYQKCSRRDRAYQIYFIFLLLNFICESRTHANYYFMCKLT